MQDFFNLVMLVCASLASMGLGVLAAYGLIKSGFVLMYWHTRQRTSSAKTQTQIAGVS